MNFQPLLRQFLLLSALFLVLLIFLLPTSVRAEGQGHVERVIVVGANRAYPPYEFLDKNGAPAGYNVDLTRAIAKVMGMQVEFHFGNWSDIRAGLASGKIDILQGLSYSEHRAQEHDFSPPTAIIQHAIFARNDSPPVSSLEELRGKKVILFKEGIMYDTLIAAGYGPDLILTGTPADALRLLSSGQHDYSIIAILPGMSLVRELNLSNLTPVTRNIAVQKYGYAVKKGNAELLARFSEGLAIVQKTGQYQAIYDQWLGVQESRRISWERAVRYGAFIVGPLLLILMATVVWSRTLQRRVTVRTAELANEVSERKRALEELQRHQDKLIQADKMASLGILVSGVAHEINNPNALILLNTPILKEAYADAIEILEEHYHQHGDFSLGGLPYSRMRQEVPRLTDEVQESARRIRRIVDDLKDFSRRDDAAISTFFALNPIVEAALRLVDPTLRKATAHFSAELASDLPEICGSPQRIEQVVINLVLNACQALADRNGTITIRTRLDSSGAEVILEVRDSGCGILPEHLPHLTDPFFTTNREIGGTGLGLAISAGIIEKHGGTLEFASTSGVGTTVTVHLPTPPREFAP
jgi:polar amino acid transport system substrate-binding protein